MRLKTYLLFFLLIINPCCQINKKNTNGNQVKFISLNLDKKKEFYFLDFIDIDTIIHLETKESSLISEISKLYFTKHYIYIFDENQKKILQFKRNGKYVKDIGKEGRGPIEYVKPIDICVSEEFNKIIVLEDVKRLTIYNLDGSFIEKINLPFFFNKIEIVSDKTFIFLAYNSPKGHDDKNAFIVNSKGKTLFSGLSYDNYLSGLSVSLDNSITRFNNNINYIRAFDDTIYTIIDNRLIPKFYLDFGKDKLSAEFIKNQILKSGEKNLQSIIPKLVASKYVSWIPRFSETNNYLYIGFKQNNNFYSLYYDKKTSEFKLYNHNNLHDFFFFITPLASFVDDVFINVIYPHNLFLETNKFRLDFLKREKTDQFIYAKYLKEEIMPEENPVIVLTKLRINK